jgi:hypothetical protein
LVSEVLPRPKKDDFRLDGSGRLFGSGADILLVSLPDSKLLSLGRREYDDGGAILERLFSGVVRDEAIESAELVLDPAPIHDNRGVETPPRDARHCVAILAAFSRTDGRG